MQVTTLHHTSVYPSSSLLSVTALDRGTCLLLKPCPHSSAFSAASTDLFMLHRTFSSFAPLNNSFSWFCSFLWCLFLGLFFIPCLFSKFDADMSQGFIPNPLLFLILCTPLDCLMSSQGFSCHLQCRKLNFQLRFLYWTSDIFSQLLVQYNHLFQL